MFNPLVNMNDLTDSEIENKISELGRKYFQTHNPQLQAQIATVLEMYKTEARARRAIAAQRERENNENGENSLDSLIKVS